MFEKIREFIGLLTFGILIIGISLLYFINDRQPTNFELFVTIIIGLQLNFNKK
jgi:hypothetical protein